MSDQQTEPSDEQLREQLIQRRAAAGVPADGGFRPSNSTQPDIEFRTKTCAICLEKEQKSEFKQQRFGSVWLPFFCENCTAEIQNRDSLENARRKSRDEAESIDRLFTFSGLPTEYRTRRRSLSTSHLPSSDAVMAAVSTMKSLVEGNSKKPWVYLWGAAGSFKTTIAAGFLARDLSRGRPGKYVFYLNLLTELYSIYSGDKTGARREIVHRYGSTPRLAIGDLGKERATEHAALILFEILDYRYHEDSTAPPGSRWMVIESNLSLQDLGAKISAGTDDSIAEPIVRRISELAIEIPMTETSLR